MRVHATSIAALGHYEWHPHSQIISNTFVVLLERMWFAYALYLIRAYDGVGDRERERMMAGGSCEWENQMSEINERRKMNDC